MNPSKYHFEIWNNIRRELSKNHEIRGRKKIVEQIYDNLSNTIRHDKCLLEFDRRFCNGKLGNIFQIPDYDNPTPEEKTDAILTNDRNKIGRLKIGDKTYKLQFKYRNPTTYFTVGINKKHVAAFKKKNIALLIGIPKTADISYYKSTRNVNTKEHHFFLWIPNHKKYTTYQYTEISYFKDIFFPLQPLREILDFELLEKNQSIIEDFKEDN